ncbi:MAG TPA: MFS transporter [Streptosporangiaceae bacterium]|nr:MFS transporter [Streptosporangiaceae bacterium]
MTATAGTTAPGAQSVRSTLLPLVSGQLLAGTAQWAMLLGVLDYASYTLHVGAFRIGLAGLAWGAPPAVSGSLVGRLIDGRGPRLVAASAGACGVAASLGLALSPSWNVLLGLLVLVGMSGALIRPAIDAMPSWLPQQIDHGTSSVWLTFGSSAPVVLGPLAAAGILAAGGTADLFGATAAMYAAALLVLVRTRARQRPAAAAAQPGQPGAVQPVRRIPAARSVLGISLIVWVSYGCFSVLEILYVRDVLRSPMWVFIVLQVLFAAGGLITNLALSRRPGLLGRHGALVAAVLLTGFAEMLYVISNRFFIAACGVTLWGAATAVFSPVCRVRLLNAIPAERHGAAMAAWRQGQAVGNVLPPLAAGGIAQLIGIQFTLISAAGMVVITGVWAWLARARGRALPPGDNRQPAAEGV